MAIYARSDDGGETGLGDGSRVGKGDVRGVALGEVDELNAVVGWVRTAGPPPESPVVHLRAGRTASPRTALAVPIPQIFSRGARRV